MCIFILVSIRTLTPLFVPNLTSKQPYLGDCVEQNYIKKF